MDAASKREMAILRRLAMGIVELGKKIISMNKEFLSEEEVVRVTNKEFVTVKREELAGEFDLKVDISTAEVDNAQAQDLGFMLQTMGPNMDLSMTQLILSKIADLKRMPDLAEKIRDYKPEPDPIVEETKKLELEKIRYEVEELKSKALLNRAKADEAQADADVAKLNFVEQEKGVKHERDMEKQSGQAQGNQNLEVTKALLKPKKKEETKPDIEGAVGWNEISNGSRQLGGYPAPEPALPPVPEMPITPPPLGGEIPIDPQLSSQ
jgi:hypothetical protein